MGRPKAREEDRGKALSGKVQGGVFVRLTKTALGHLDQDDARE
jgi:hypothetical protein